MGFLSISKRNGKEELFTMEEECEKKAVGTKDLILFRKTSEWPEPTTHGSEAARASEQRHVGATCWAAWQGSRAQRMALGS